MILYIFYIFLFAAAALCAWRISIADMRRRIIPDAYLFPLLLIGIIFTTTAPFWPISAIESAIAAGAGYAISAGLGYLFERRTAKNDATAPSPIGLGDVKLIATGGIWLGATGLAAALALSYIGAAVWARRNKQKFIPFAPFFIAGGILAFIMNIFLV